MNVPSPHLMPGTCVFGSQHCERETRCVPGHDCGPGFETASARTTVLVTDTLGFCCKGFRLIQWHTYLLYRLPYLLPLHLGFVVKGFSNFIHPQVRIYVYTHCNQLYANMRTSMRACATDSGLPPCMYMFNSY